MRKDAGVWSIPKGEVGPGEALLAAARRELREETGFEIDGDFVPLRPVRLRSGKIVHAFAIEGNLDPAAMSPSTFELEWPPRSGERQSFPELDRAAFFPLAEARRRLHPGQLPLLDELERLVHDGERERPDR